MGTEPDFEPESPGVVGAENFDASQFHSFDVGRIHPWIHRAGCLVSGLRYDAQNLGIEFTEWKGESIR